MPWDGNELWAAAITADGSLKDRTRVAGGPEESIYQPEWSPDGVLHFVSDRSGFWNLYRQEGEQAEALYPLEADFGRPQWVFGSGTYTFVTPRRILCAYTQGGIWSLAFLDLDAGDLERLQLPFSEYGRPRVRTDKAYLLAAGPAEPMAVIEIDLRSGRYVTLRRSSDQSVDLNSQFVLNRFDFQIKYPGKANDLVRKEVVIRLNVKGTPGKANALASNL